MKLLPCPFCGIALGRTHDPGCYLRLLAEYRSDHLISGAELDAAWNKRHDPRTAPNPQVTSGPQAPLSPVDGQTLPGETP